MILQLFRTRPEREAQRLDKDAATILDMARHTYRESVLASIASTTRVGIRQVVDLAGGDPALRERELDRFRALHREARRRHDQAGLTAYTLVIIHTHSLALDDLGAPARETIQVFLDEWPAEDEPDEGTLAG